MFASVALEAIGFCVFKTVTVTSSKLVQPELVSVAVTLYVVVTEGLAIGVAMVVLDNPVEGVQE